MRRGFVPRYHRSHTIAPLMDWSVGLTQWTHTVAHAVATVWAAHTNCTTRATNAVIRRTMKKKAHWSLNTHPGGAVTAKAAGTRMGKGKGKLVGTRGWHPRGCRVGTLTGEVTLRSKRWSKQTAARIVVLPAGY